MILLVLSEGRGRKNVFEIKRGGGVGVREGEGE